MCFQGAKWQGAGVILKKAARMLRDWKLIQQEEEADHLERLARELERRSLLPPAITWEEARPLTSVSEISVAEMNVLCNNVELESVSSMAVSPDDVLATLPVAHVSGACINDDLMWTLLLIKSRATLSLKKTQMTHHSRRDSKQ
jgi:hypothetical protein